MRRAFIAQCAFQFRHQREVACRERGGGDDVDPGLAGIGGGLFRCLEERADLDIPAKVHQRGGDNLLSAVVSVLAHLGDIDLRLAAMFLFKVCGEGRGGLGLVVALHAAAINALDGADDGLMAALAALNGFGNLAHRRLGAGGIHGQREQIALGAGGSLGNCVQLGGNLCLVAFGFQACQLVQLHAAHGGIVHLQHGDVFFLVQQEFVHADHGLRAAVDARLRIGRGLFDAQFRQAFLDGLGHAAHLFDFGDVGEGLFGKVVRQAFDIVGAAPHIDCLARAAFLLQEELRVAADPGGEVGWQGEGLIEAVRVQRLGLAARGCNGLKAGADDIVVDILRGQGPAGSL